MDHNDHVNLLRGCVEPCGTWADLGAGTGAFTLALADLLGPGAVIHAVDRDARALRTNAEAMRERFPAVALHAVNADFAKALDLPPLDGGVMANSLHFEREQEAIIERMRRHLKPGGRLVVVEYNIERGNGAVPFPVPEERWDRLAKGAGFERTEVLFRRPSRFGREICSALSC